MYFEFYGFIEDPFKITPDPDYMYLSSKHEEALELLEYGIKYRKGFITLVGEVGTGKSTLIRFLVRKYPDYHISLILNPFLSPDELLYSIAKDFGIDISLCLNKGDVLQELTNFLVNTYKSNKNAVVIVDEAQNLSLESFEMIRQISNIELENDKLIQIILSGQTELETLLKKEELRQLNQRISVRATLKNFDFNDTENYIIHRINVAAGIRRYIFDKSAIKQIYKYTKGNPREINQICDKALLIGYSLQKKKIDRSVIDKASKEYYINQDKKPALRWLYYSIPILMIGTIILSLSYVQTKNEPTIIPIELKDNISIPKINEHHTDNNSTDNKSSDNIISDNKTYEKKNNTTTHTTETKYCLFTKTNINLRNKSSLSSGVKLVLKKDHRYILDNFIEHNEWLLISIDNLTGYIYNNKKLFEIRVCE
ncbi:MAG: AAA family ATPase [Calditerrivibrio sp.]|nr:AAA family ATPase [Calditerrivibrio sp.]